MASPMAPTAPAVTASLPPTQALIEIAHGAGRREPGRPGRAAGPRSGPPPAGPRDRRPLAVRPGRGGAPARPRAFARRCPRAGRAGRSPARAHTSSPVPSSPARPRSRPSRTTHPRTASSSTRWSSSAGTTEATTEVKRMVKLSADLPSLARLSYLRELHGDLPGALEAMRRGGRFTRTRAGEHGVRHGAPRATSSSPTATPTRRRPRTRRHSTSFPTTPRRSRAWVGWRSAGATSPRPPDSSSGPPRSCRCPSTSSRSGQIGPVGLELGGADAGLARSGRTERGHRLEQGGVVGRGSRAGRGRDRDHGDKEQRTREGDRSRAVTETT